jgi:hypothetical protein
MSLQKKYLPVRLLSASVNSQSKPPASSRTKVFPMADETACFMVIDGMDGPVQVKERPTDCFRIVKNSGEDNLRPQFPALPAQYYCGNDLSTWIDELTPIGHIVRIW